MNVPFVDLHAQYLSIRDEIDAAIQSVIDSTAFVGGTFVRDFEEAFAHELGVKHVIGVANGTDALFITMKMLGVGEGDEVITTATSWIASSETISQTGARPVFVDIDPVYYTIDENKIEEKITERTRAILPVHLYGQMAEMDTILSIAHEHNLMVIEDCAQSHFSMYKGRYAGTMGNAGTFSFYPGKNLGAYGDAGAIVTNDDDLARRCRMFANHGQVRKHQHEMEGINSRLDGLQAAILMAKLPYIHTWNNQRIQHAKTYSTALNEADSVLELPRVRPETVHTFHVFSVRSPERDELMAQLKANGISAAVHYPQALPMLPVYRGFNHAEDFPEALRHQEQQLSLPMYPELDTSTVKDISRYITSTLTVRNQA